MAIKRISVDSSMIDSIGYDPKNKLLEIKFLSSHIYHYEDVPPEIFDEFLNADSKGRFFLDYIEDEYEFYKLR